MITRAPVGILHRLRHPGPIERTDGRAARNGAGAVSMLCCALKGARSRLCLRWRGTSSATSPRERDGFGLLAHPLRFSVLALAVAAASLTLAREASGQPTEFKLTASDAAAGDTDASGNTTTCSFEIVVNDAEPPTITGCPAGTGPNESVAKVDADASCEALVPDLTGLLTIEDNCPGVTFIQDPAPESVSAAGPGFYDVAVTATDANGLTSTCALTYQVNDVIDPVITRCPADLTGANALPANATLGCVALLPDLRGELVGEDNCGQLPPGSGLTVFQSPAPGTEIPVGTTLVTLTLRDASGNDDTCTVEVEVLPVQELALDVALTGSFAGAFERCMILELWWCPEDAAPAFSLEMNGAFISGALAETMEVPCGAYTCATLRDPLHSLIARVPVTQSAAQHVVSATLVLGNLNGDEVIDILDFGTYAGQFGIAYGSPSTDCATPGAHADLNGDGVVTPADETFISASFLSIGDDPCCAMGAVAATDGPVVEISVAELVLRGMGDLAVADLNEDGLLNTADIAAFLAGARPALPSVAFVGKDGGAWFDESNWASGRQPTAETNIALSKTAVIDREGATARNVTVQAGGELLLQDGALTAQTMTIETGGTLRLSGDASLLEVQSLTLSEGATLDWNGGALEVHGGMLRQADLDLLIGSGTLRLMGGAAATATRDLIIGLTPEGIAALELDGPGTALLAAEAIFVGMDGVGALRLRDSALVIAPGLFIGPLGELTGAGELQSNLSNDGTIAPAGTFFINGQYAQSDLGTLEIRVAEDRLRVNGVAQLGGTLLVEVSDGVKPGEQFTIITASSILGAFTDVVTPAGAEVAMTYELDAVIVTVR